MRPRLMMSILALLCLMAVPLAVKAQEQQKIYIESFTQDPLDQTAKNHPKRDSNGDLYSVVKVRPASAAFNFRFGMMKCIVDTQPHSGETWLYVQKNARRISIEREGFEPIKNTDLGITLEAGVTYILKLSYVEPTQTVQKQILQFIVSPADSKATVKVRKTGAESYELWGQVDRNGSISRYLECGRYEYQIVAENYLSDDGVVSLNTPNKTLEEKVKLKPNFGYLQIDDAYGISGAQIYINDKLVGTVPYAKSQWEAGDYTLSITNGEMYKTYTRQFTILNGETVVLKPKLESRTGETRLVVDADAEIYLDKALKGTREWNGILKEGRYEVECRMASHESTFKTIEVKANVPQTFLLDIPRPITGAIAITTSPSFATIVMDGKEIGHTPTVLEGVIIGQHSIELSLKNHKTENVTVEVKKGRTEELQFTMSTMAHMTIDSDPAGATLYIDGKQVGTTPYTADMASGDHSMKIEKKGYKPLEQTVHLDASHPTEKFTLKRQLVQPFGLYLQPTFQAGSLKSFGGALGGYIANVNVEASYLVGMGKSETIYWNYTGSSSRQPESETLSASYIGGKVGYGIRIGRSLRLTPQVGVGTVNIKGDASSGNAVSASVGVRIEYIIVNHFGVSIAPEYGFMVKKSDIYEKLSAVSPTIKGWASGFNARIGIFFCI